MNIYLKNPPPAVTKSHVPLIKDFRLNYLSDSFPELRSYKEEKVKIIQRAWLSYINRIIFRLLRHIICAVEHYVTSEILQNASPSEAELMKDPTMKHKVKFRFSGETFPPYIVFKIFLHSDGHGYKYFCGRNILKSSTKAIADTYRLVGEKKLYSQMMEDELIHQKFEISDEVDVVTTKDYMQYSNLLDQIPASRGGKNNPWRRLELKNIPKSMMIYDILDFIESGTLSNRLFKQLKFLVQKPQSEEMHRRQLEIITEVRVTEPKALIQLPAKQVDNEIKYMVYKSKQARKEAKTVKKACMTPIKKNMNIQMGEKPSLKQIILFDSSFDLVKTNEITTDPIYTSENFKKDKEELLDWCEKLLSSKTLNATKRLRNLQ
ncbi:uncharacterized protein CXorf58 homolog isoform X1 [Sorex araneus]|uniref:uncharacterized protein CXorf58 homolog isoform X1 n=1 Tax=Sorex araneus TaxID=42254 RepID=UPI002433B175|nr:uncharacterized protein CXorf58 homolog isoform X1 [Sorex araneus]